MAKLSTRYTCQACGYTSPRWMGRCPECSAYSTFSEETVVAPSRKEAAAVRAAAAVSMWSTRPEPLSAIKTETAERLATDMPELDRVLGGGLVRGSLVLVGGDPGIGKSTLLIEAAVKLANSYGSGLYVSGEESVGQVGLRARRLNLAGENLLLAAETDLMAIAAHIRELKPRVVVVDSIQTVFSPGLESAPGTISQVREAAAQLQRVAKEENVPVFLVGHVTKEGNLAGPRALEHIVDAVLQLEGEEHTPYRILRAAKNRFGSTNEIGVFEMSEGGMLSVENPSRLFLSQRQEAASGSAVAAVMEGARPLLVEVQALCAPSYFAAPRRVVTGTDYNRVLVALAVIEKRVGLRLGDMDVYINVAGGVKVNEPALDLAVAMAVVSSLRDTALPAGLCVFGEVGLGGEIRAVGQTARRAAEAARLGFSSCLLPANGLENVTGLPPHIALHGVKSLGEAVEHWFPGARNRSRSESNGASGATSLPGRRRSGAGSGPVNNGEAGNGDEGEAVTPGPRSGRGAQNRGTRASRGARSLQPQDGQETEADFEPEM